MNFPSTSSSGPSNKVQSQTKRSNDPPKRLRREDLFDDEEIDGQDDDYCDDDDENDADLMNRASIGDRSSSASLSFTTIQQSSAAPSSSAARAVTSRSHSSTASGTTTTTLAGVQTSRWFTESSDEEPTENPNAVARSKKKVPKRAQEQGDKAPTEISMTDSEAEENDDSEEELEETDDGDHCDSLPKRKRRHLESLRKGEKLTTPSSRPKTLRTGVPIDQRKKVEKFLDILGEQNRLKCESDADFVEMLFFLTENYDSKRKCVEAFTDLLNTRNPHLRPTLREYFIMHYLVRLRPQTAKKFGSALRQAIEYHILDFVPSDLRPKLTSILEKYPLLDTLSKMPNSRWLTNFVPDPAIWLIPRLYWQV